MLLSYVVVIERRKRVVGGVPKVFLNRTKEDAERIKNLSKGKLEGNLKRATASPHTGGVALFFASTQGGKHERGNNHSPLCTWNHVGIRRGLHLIKSAFQ
jgi:hypothetical protein